MNNRRWVVDDGLALLLKWSRLFGTAPVRFEKQFGKVVKFSRPYHVLSVLLGLSVCSYLAIQTAFYKSKDIVLNKNAETVSVYTHIITFNKIFDILYYVLFLFFSIYITFSNKIRLGKLLCCYSRIIQIKKDIFFKEIKDSSVLRKWQIGLVLFSVQILSCALIYVTTALFNSDSFIVICLDLLAISFCITTSWQFVVVAQCANSAFGNINNTLEAILCDLSDSSGSDHANNPILCLESINCNLYIPISSISRAIDLIGNVDEMYPNIDTRLAKFATLIEQLCSAFEKVSGVIRDMNNIESYNFVMYMFHFLIHVTWCTFDCIVTLQWKQDDMKTIYNDALWTVYYVLIVLPVIEVCHDTRQRVAHTRVLLGKLMTMSLKSPLMADATDAFSSRLMLNDDSFSVFNICYLDRTIFYSILGCSTTFIVLFFSLSR